MEMKKVVAMLTVCLLLTVVSGMALCDPHQVPDPNSVIIVETE